MSSAFNFVIDAWLSKAVYTSNNTSTSSAVNGWEPVEVDLKGYIPPGTFGAQLYKGPDGQYKLAFRGTEGNFAILGNHDLLYEPNRVRESLAAAGYTVLGNGWKEATIRGVRGVVVGHEGPWFDPPPDLTSAPKDGPRICLSHSPDNFYWAQENGIGLVLCGHVHGGQIRLPPIGSIFVPSTYGRRFDMGAFEKNGTAMVVNRGLSGKEPLRFRCNAQVMRITLSRSPG